MPKKPPIALIIFSNDLDNYLPNIETERKIIEEALEHYDDTNRLKIIARASVSISELFRLFNRYSGRIVLFHFAGHTKGNGLQFNETVDNPETAKAEGIADLIGREVNDGILKFVFLNGCSSAAQVERLKAVGVSAVIATHYPISDNKAVQFAGTFYRTWAKSDDLQNAFENPLTTIQTAFETSLAYLKTRYTVQVKDKTRGFIFEIKEIETEVAWELFTEKPDLTLQFDIATESKTFNEYLTWNLVNSMTKHENVQTFLVDNSEDWDVNMQSQKVARRKIEEQFPWVISWELRRLFSIGSDSLSQEKIDDYVNHCLRTYRLTLQLVNFTLVTQLWDNKQAIDANESDLLRSFFNQKQPFTTAKHFQLFNELRNIYINHQIDFPFAELSTENFQSKQAIFNRACEKLQILEETVFNKDKNTEKHCFHAEKQLTTVLETLIFIADFQLVSMRKIEYQRLRDNQDEPNYIKDFNILGKRQPKQQGEHQRLVQYDKIPTDAYAVFLHKKGASFNLFPFVLDYNALVNEPLSSKIYFYECREAKHGLKYFFIDGENEDVLNYSGINQKVAINPILDNDGENQLKIDIALEQFIAANNTLFGKAETFTPYRQTTEAFNF
jgi:hypothetical protein